MDGYDQYTLYKFMELSRIQMLLQITLTVSPFSLSPTRCCRKPLLYSQGAHGGDLGVVVRAGRARVAPGQAAGTQLQECQEAGQCQRGLHQVQTGAGTPGSCPQ